MVTLLNAGLGYLIRRSYREYMLILICWICLDCQCFLSPTASDCWFSSDGLGFRTWTVNVSGWRSLMVKTSYFHPSPYHFPLTIVSYIP